MSKHTLGPWIARKGQFGGSTFGIFGGGDLVTPIAMTVSNASPRGMRMARRGEIEANANLIAAAPELLQALIAAEEALRAAGRGSGGAYEDVVRAISKAEGTT